MSGFFVCSVSIVVLSLRVLRMKIGKLTPTLTAVNMVTNSNDANETETHMEDNIDWVLANVEAYEANIDAIFVMGYRRLLVTENALFYNDMLSFKQQDQYKDLLFVYARRASESDRRHQNICRVEGR